MALERDYQRGLVKRLKARYPGAYVMKTDPTQIQGIPDLLVLSHGKYAALEVKRSSRASHRPNQDYYIQQINDDHGFASFVNPDNEEAVLESMDVYFAKE